MCKSFRSALIVAILAAALPSTALAKSKAKETKSVEPEKPSEPAPAAQAQDNEQPKAETARTAGPPPEAPKPDAFGRVPYGPHSATSGKAVGMIEVKATGADGKVQVWIDGRYFGMAPLTISAVPGGDYIVEGVYPDNKTVSRPVSVVAGESASVDLKSKISGPEMGAAGPGQQGEDAKVPGGVKTGYLVMGAGGVAIIGGVVFAILFKGKQDDYNKAVFTGPENQANVDSIGNAAKKDALMANICFIVGGGAVLTGAVLWYAAHQDEQAKTVASAPRTMVMVAPTEGGAQAGFSMRF